VNQVLSHLNVKISDEKKKQFETDLDKYINNNNFKLYNLIYFNIIRNGDGTISFVEFVMFYEKGKYKDYL
jgi:hypothetical protein